MRYPWSRRPGRSRTLGAIVRTGSALGFACLLPSIVGCQTVSREEMVRKSEGATDKEVKTASNSSPSDFHRDVTPDQQFNVHIELGRVYESQKEYAAALAEYQKSLEVCNRRGFGTGLKGSGEKQALVHRRIGGALDRLGRFAQSEDHYRLALKASPDDAKVWNDSGYSYYLQSRWVDSERNLKTAAKLAPEDVRVQTNLGLTLAAMGKTDEALVALSRAGGNAVAHANLGYLLAAMGQKEEAKAHYKTAIELQPNLAPARQALAALDDKGPKVEQVATAIALPAPTTASLPAPTTASLPAPTTAPLPAPTTIPLPAPTTIPPPVRIADASIRRTTGPSATPVSVSPLPPLSTSPK